MKRLVDYINENIGLMYPSDYAFAAMETDTCLSDTWLINYSNCVESNWINQGSINFQWFISPWTI